MPSGTSKVQRFVSHAGPYRPPSLINLNTPHSIESTLVKVLSQREQFPGYTYAYYSSSYPGMVKIGMTKQERNISLTGSNALPLVSTHKLLVASAVSLDYIHNSVEKRLLFNMPFAFNNSSEPNLWPVEKRSPVKLAAITTENGSRRLSSMLLLSLKNIRLMRTQSHMSIPATTSGK